MVFRSNIFFQRVAAQMGAKLYCTKTTHTKGMVRAKIKKSWSHYNNLLLHIFILGLYRVAIKIILNDLILSLTAAPRFYLKQTISNPLTLSLLSSDWVPLDNRFEEQGLELLCSQPEPSAWDYHIRNICFLLHDELSAHWDYLYTHCSSPSMTLKARKSIMGLLLKTHTVATS